MIDQKNQVQEGTRQTLLLVEDELLLRMMMSDILERLDYSVLAAQSAEEALEIIEAGKDFDLLLTDIVMSGAMNGFQLAEEVRKQFPKKPIIYSSGYTQYTERQMGRVKAPILEKLATPREIAEIVDRCLRNVQNEAA